MFEPYLLLCSIIAHKIEIQLLNSKSCLLQGCDAAYLTNVHSEFEGHSDFVKGEDARNWDKQFGIRHYAGVVTYSVEGFVDKNRDTQQDVFFDSLAKSNSSFINELCEFKVC